MVSRKAKRITRIIILSLLIIILIGFILPEPFSMPVEGATSENYDQKSFWFYPWGKSVTHKGVDIFARRNTAIHSSTYGIVLYHGKSNMGGNIVYVLGPKWTIHYYAHMDTIKTKMFSLVSTKSIIGTVGSTGNAAGKLPHLHYTMKRVFPLPWKYESGIQGWKKMFYINPVPYLNKSINYQP
jgi:peptidoglycan LD-endopeptidase LytH